MNLQQLKDREAAIKAELKENRSRYLYHRTRYLKLNSLFQSRAVELHDIQKEIFRLEGRVKQLPPQTSNQTKAKSKPAPLSSNQMVEAFKQVSPEKRKALLARLKGGLDDL